MLSWMLYSIVVSLLMGLAALALERSAQIRQKAGALAVGYVYGWLLSRSSSSLPRCRCRSRKRRMPTGDIFRNTHAPANDSNRNVAVHVAIIGTDQTPVI